MADSGMLDVGALIEALYAAAERQRRSVRGGRQEGVATGILGDIGEIPMNMVGSFKNMMDAAYSHPPGMSVQDNPQYSGLVAENAMNFIGGASPFAQAGAAGIFGGRLAKTADHAALARAEEMAAKGVPREQIWSDTGWFRGADDKWRFEIPDDTSVFNRDAMRDKDYTFLGNTVRGREGVAGDVISHPSAFDAYPDMRQMTVGQTRYDNNLGTYHQGAPEMIGLDASLLDAAEHGGARSTMLHELQHAVQEREGFAKGGNSQHVGPAPNPRYKKYLDALNSDAELMRYRELRRSPERAAEITAQNREWSAKFQDRVQEHYNKGRDYKKKDVDNIFREFEEWKDGKFPLDEEVTRLSKSLRERGIPVNEPAETVSGYDAYRLLGGEVESRNVQMRRDMTGDERRARPPWTTQDEPDQDQIIRLLLGQ
jgi:hypothetical protein